jgi:hypothetical protein
MSKNTNTIHETPADKNGRRFATYTDKTTDSCCIFVGSGDDEPGRFANEEYQKQLKAGHCVSANNKTQWIEFITIRDKNGNETWKGDYAKGERILVTLYNIDKPTGSGERYTTREVLGTSWRKI